MNLWVDLNKIVIPFIYSVFTLSFGLLFSESDSKSLELIFYASCLFLLAGILIYKAYGRVNKAVYTYTIFGLILVFLSIFTYGEIVRKVLEYSLYTLSVVFIILSIYMTVSLNAVKNKVYEYLNTYINFDKFKPNFLLTFILLLGNFLIIFPLLIFKNTYMSIFFFVLYSCIIGYIINYNLYKYKYAFYLICNSEKSYVLLNSMYDGDDVLKYNWFMYNIEPYIKHIRYDRTKQIIYFCSLQEIRNKNNVKSENYTLYKAVNAVDSLIININDENIKNIISSIKDILVKIDNYHKAEEYKFNKYIQNINEKYVPYIEKLVSSYINNKELPSDITEQMQEKIILSLKDIEDALKEILVKMYNKNMLELKSHMEAFNVLLAQSGFKDNIKGDN